MSTTTTNYSLVKPALTDPADITAMNPNWDKIDTELKKRALLGDDGLIDPSQMPDIDVSGKVSKTGDTMTGVLSFQNKNEYAAVGKTRTINGIDYFMNIGVGQLGSVGCASMESHVNNQVTGRLEVSRFGVAFVDEHGSRNYLYRSGAVAASVES